MVLFGGFLGIVALAVWIFCVIDVLTTPGARMRSLPKIAWVLIVVLLVDLGSLAWLVAGRPWGVRTSTPGGGAVGGGGGWGSGTSAIGPRRRPTRRPSTPDDDEEFLADLDRRLAEQKRRDQDGPESA